MLLLFIAAIVFVVWFMYKQSEESNKQIRELQEKEKQYLTKIKELEMALKNSKAQINTEPEQKNTINIYQTFEKKALDLISKNKFKETAFETKTFIESHCNVRKSDLHHSVAVLEGEYAGLSSRELKIGEINQPALTSLNSRLLTFIQNDLLAAYNEK